MQAFLSYQTADKLVAGRIKALLDPLGIPSFMAHEDIGVSEEWRIEILKEIRKSDLFIAILSKNYYGSVWCVQESGIAAFRKMTIIPLSIDGSIPQGFISHVQSTKINPEAPTRDDLLPGIAKHDIKFVLDILIKLIGSSGNYRVAEANFELILPYLGKAPKDKIVELLNVSTANGQVCHAALCAQKYLPPLYKTYGKLLDMTTNIKLNQTLRQYVPAADWLPTDYRRHRASG